MHFESSDRCDVSLINIYLRLTHHPDNLYYFLAGQGKYHAYELFVYSTPTTHHSHSQCFFPHNAVSWGVRMSFQAICVHKHRTSNSPSKTNSTWHAEPLPSNHHLVPPHLVPKQRRGYGTKGLVDYCPEPLLTEPHWLVFTQPLLVSGSPSQFHNSSMNGQPDISDPFAMEDLLGFEQPCSPIGLHIRESSVPSDTTRLKALKRKEQQWARWNEVIPLLIRPYMEFFHMTDSLRNSAPMNSNCPPQSFSGDSKYRCSRHCPEISSRPEESFLDWGVYHKGL